ncbi:MAG: glycerol-3-phosphate 1-O-acyltransferase PlsY [Lachnospiraceae bacterium]|nr:glycerol-3-phosphate 1-O-acyltransferase PlsY [Lachnospiraceae bacterium]
MTTTIAIILSIVIGYLLGSIPFALVIGKVFFKTDIRNFGSKNLGGGNAGRVLGKKAGLAVMTMDILKVTLAIFLASLFGQGELPMILAGLAAAAGHCFPLFAHFKGGKAVATMYGFLFGMGIFGGYGLILFIFPLLVFLLVLYIWKIIALASICSAVAITVFVFVTTGSVPMTVTLLIFTVLMIIRHKKNIQRMINHEENKISWM